MTVLNRFEAHEDRLAERVYAKLMQVINYHNNILFYLRWKILFKTKNCFDKAKEKTEEIICNSSKIITLKIPFNLLRQRRFCIVPKLTYRYTKRQRFIV